MEARNHDSVRLGVPPGTIDGTREVSAPDSRPTSLCWRLSHMVRVNYLILKVLSQLFAKSHYNDLMAMWLGTLRIQNFGSQSRPWFLRWT